MGSGPLVSSDGICCIFRYFTDCSGIPDEHSKAKQLSIRNSTIRHLVQCKHWRASKVVVTVVRELYGVMTSETAFSVSVVTSGVFTEEARQFADGKSIDLIDGVQLERLIDELSPQLNPHR